MLPMTKDAAVGIDARTRVGKGNAGLLAETGHIVDAHRHKKRRVWYVGAAIQVRGEV